MPKKFWKGLAFALPTSILMWLLIIKVCFGATYYVDSAVTDTHVASATPDFTTYDHTAFTETGGTDSVYKTIADLNLKAFAAGDFVLFRKGQTWREQLTVPSSGSAGLPITFGAYGSGEKPIIDGRVLLTHFENMIDLLANGYMDTSVTGWTSGSGTVAWSAAGVGGRTNIFKMTITDGGGYVAISQTGLTIASGTEYTYSFKFYVPSTNTTTNGIRMRVGVNYAWVEAGTTATDVWTTVSGTYTPIANQDRVMFYAVDDLSEATSTIGDIVYLDDIKWGVALGAGVYSQTVAAGQLSVAPKQVYFDTLMGTPVANAAAVNGVGEWFYDTVPARLYIYSVSDPATLYTNPGIGANQKDHAIVGSNKNYITIDGLFLCGANDSVLLCDGTSAYWTVQNNTITNSWFGARLIGSAGNATAKNNTVHDVSGLGIEVSSSAANGHLVQGNTIYNITTGELSYMQGVMFTGTGGTIEGNTIYNIGNVGVADAGNHEHCIYVNHSSNVIVRKNKTSLATGMGIKFAASTSSTAYYNISFGNGDSGIKTETQDAVVPDGISIYDNSTYGNGNHGIYIMAGTNITIKNNIMSDNLPGLWGEPAQLFVDISSLATLISDYNIFYQSSGDQAKLVLKYNGGVCTWYTFAGWQALGYDTHSVNADPLFVSTVTPDFHLQSTSPAINAGVDVGLTQDYEGIAVPKGSGFDIGAYEFFRGKSWVLKKGYIGSSRINERIN